MLASVRAGLFAALVSLVSISAFASDKTFHHSDLEESAVTLEAGIKDEAGVAAKAVGALRKDAEALAQVNDFAGAAAIYAQVAAKAPKESLSWRNLAETLLHVPTSDNADENSSRVSRATTAAYIAYQRADKPQDEAASLELLGIGLARQSAWRASMQALKASLALAETEDVRVFYDQLRAEHGFRVVNHTIDADTSPRACFQFSEPLPAKQVDFEPFVAVAGQDRPALSVQDQQLCVEGLKHGEGYEIVFRAGLPSVIEDESLLRRADFNIYVRDRSPFVRLAGKAYVLPRKGQQGIPLVSVNAEKLGISIYRIGDRNLMGSVMGWDFQRNLYSYDLETIADEKGERVWQGELDVESPLNAEVTTAFPVDEAVGPMEPGLYILAAQAASNSASEYSERATQWFIVSDFGLAAFSGADGIHAFVNSLASTKALDGVELRLIARNNEVLATKLTDASGQVHFEAGLARGEGGSSPALLVASGADGDYAFLNLRNFAFDLTDRGVAGRPSPEGLDAFVFAERGVYRPGEVVHLTAMLRDGNGVAVSGTPLTLVVERPDGVEYRRNVLQDQGMGGRTLSVPIIPSAGTGSWKVRAYADPKGRAVGETSFLVEDYVPERLEFALKANSEAISVNTPAEIVAEARFLYGAPAAELALAGDITIGTAAERPGFAGYRFGHDDEGTVREIWPIEGLPETDAEGKAVFDMEMDEVPSSTRPLEAQITLRLAEPGGRSVENSVTLPVTPDAAMIGVKPLFAGRALGDNDKAEFDVVMVEADGTRMEQQNLRWQLLRLDSRYQWYRSQGYWEYEPVKITSRVADGTIDVTAETPGRISVPVSWGRYKLEIDTEAQENGPVASFGFDAGWYAEVSADTPDMLEIALDKKDYKPGETMTVAVTARTAGRVSLAVIGDRLVTTKTADVTPGVTGLPLTVGENWGTGAYVVATLRRPLDEDAARMPGRAIGLQWFNVDRKGHMLTVAMDAPELVRPETTLTVPIKIAGLPPGQQAYLVASAVDVGILNLTNYKTPSPDEHYLGQRQLGAEIRDLYGQLIDGMQGTRGRIRTGGDGGGLEMQGSPPTQPPLALFSGVVTVDEDGTASVSFELPPFTGTARVAAIAWSKDQVGHGEADVVVRDPVVVTATLPRFLLTGDRSTLRLDLDNIEGEAGVYEIAVSTDGPLSVGEPERRLSLEAKKRGGISLPITAAGTGVGDGTVRVAVRGPREFAVTRGYTLNVRPSNQIMARRTVKPLAKGESLTLSDDLFAELVPGTESVALSVGPIAALDIAGLLASLDRFPLGCTEQIVSRAMPLLYLSALSADVDVAQDAELKERMQKAIDIVLARQGSDGSFGLWQAWGQDAWLDSYVTDFLTRARASGYSIPDQNYKLALNRLRNFVSTAPDPKSDGGLALAYALYVLARNGAAPVGDLRYIADTKINELSTATAQAGIGAALAMLGDRTRAEKAFSAALGSLPEDPQLQTGRTDFGSLLRDAAAVVTLAAESDAPAQTVRRATQRIEAARKLVRRTSTQEDAWLVLAAHALGKQEVALSVAGEDAAEPVYRDFTRGEIAAGGVAVANLGEMPVQAVVSVAGAPLSSEPATDQGFGLERTFHALDGTPVDIAQVKQNDRIVVVLSVTEPQPEFARVALTDYIPAGFEIDNPRLVSSADTSGLSWIETAADPVHSEFRDDRFTAAFDRKADSKPVYSVAYVVRAVSPGSYMLPQAVVEDMYRPDRLGRTETGAVEVVTGR